MGIIVYCDGGSRGNPGPAASSYVVTKSGEVIAENSAFLGRKTNNYAEYHSAVQAVKWMVKNIDKKSTDRIVLRMDSQLVVKQLTGEFKVKSKNLIPLFVKLKKLEISFGKKINYKWSPRDENKRADYLVNLELDRNA